MAKITKNPTKPKKRPGATEFYFWIDAFTPATIPMARLAEYMRELATILGEPAFVHFVRLKRGSTGIVHKVQIEAVPKVRDRATSVRRGEHQLSACPAGSTSTKSAGRPNRRLSMITSIA